MTLRSDLLDATIADVFGGDPARYSVRSDLQSWSKDGRASGYFDSTGDWHWLIYNDSTTLGGPNPQPNYTTVLKSPVLYVGTGQAAVAALRFAVEQFVPAMTVVHWEARWGTDLEMSVATPYINAVVPGSSGPYVIDSLACPNVLVNWTSTDPSNLKISCVDAQGKTHPASTQLSQQLVGISSQLAGQAITQPASGSTGGTQGGGGSGSGPPQQGQTQRLYAPIPYNSYPPRTHSAYNALRRMTIDHSTGLMYGIGDTYWQWQEWIQAGSTPGQEPPEDGLWTVPADIDAFTPHSRQAIYVDELSGSFYGSLAAKDLDKLAYDDDQGKLYGLLPNGSVQGVNFPRLITIDSSTGAVTDLGNVTNPNNTIPNLQITFSDIFYDYHNGKLMISCWEQYTKVTDYYTLNGQSVQAGVQQRNVFRNAIHEITRLAGVNPLKRVWTSREIVLPPLPSTLEDAGYYKIVSVACSSQANKMYAAAMKPFEETDHTTPDRWLIALDITASASDNEVAKISSDSINSINYNPLTNRLYGVLYNNWSTAEIEKSDVGFDPVTIPPPSQPSSGGGGRSGGGTGGGGSQAPLLSIATQTIPNAIENANYNTSLVAVNGTGPFTWSLIAGTLPPGFSLGGSTTSTETLAATAPHTPGSYAFTIQVEDSLGAKAHVPYALTIAPAAGSAGLPRNPGALIVDVLNSGAANDLAYTRLNGVNQNVWDSYDFLVITMMSSRVGQLVEIEYGDIGSKSQLSVVKGSSLATAKQTSQQQAVTQAKLSAARPTGSLGLATGIGRQPSYNRVLVNFQAANQLQDVLIPIDSSRFPPGSSLSHIGFKVVDASQAFAFAVTRIELQKTLSSAAIGFLTQSETFLKAFGIAAPFSANDYRAMAKFIQYRVTLTTQVPPITPKIIDKTEHEINAATVYNHPLSRLRGGRRRTPYTSIDDGTNPYEMQNLYYSQSPISVPGGYIEDGFALEPSKEPVRSPDIYFGVGGAVFSVSPPL